MKPQQIQAGTKFGKLTIVTKSTKPSSWVCQCECGNTKEIRGSSLTSGRSKSCGCSRVKHGARAGGSETSTYATWRNMLARCRDSQNERYGGKHIRVCNKWAEYTSFVADMGERPAGHTLDRIDVLGDYTSQNCRWATSTQQRDNRSDTQFLVYDNCYFYWRNTVREWAEFLAQQTGKPWTVKTLRATLKLLTLTQIIDAHSDYRRTPDELYEEGQRRLRMRARAAFGLNYPPADQLTEVDRAVIEEFGCGSTDRPEPILPEHLTPEIVEIMEETSRLVMA